MQDQYQVSHVEQVPVKEEKRVVTDKICIFIYCLFTVIMLIMAIISLNVENLRKMSYANDGEGRACGYDTQEYPYLYFASLSDPSKRMCIKKCPTAGDTMLECYPLQNLGCSQNSNPKYQVQVYDSYLDESRIGLFCLPTNDDDKQSVLSHAGITQKYNFLAFYDALWRGLWMSAAMALIYLVLLQCFPLVIIPWVILLGGLMFLAFGILAIAMGTGSIIVRIILLIFLIMLGSTSAYTLLNEKRRSSVFICARLVQEATRVLESQYALLLFIPIFLAMFMCLLVLVGFETLAMWSVGELVFVPEDPFYQIKGFFSNFATVLVFFQFFWGMSFLKQAFNFTISGYAVQYYHYKKSKQNEISFCHSFKLLILKHFGSVAGGSFLLGLFYFFDYAFDFICPQSAEKQDQPNYNQRTVDEQNKYTPAVLFNLVRSESMGYINNICLPYCNSSRYCELLSMHSRFYPFDQTTNRVYRLCAHGLICAINIIVQIALMKQSSGSSSVFGVLFLTAVTVFVVTYFISLHGDLAEGLLISLFIEQNLSRANRPKSQVQENDRLSIPTQEIIEMYRDGISKKYASKSITQLLFWQCDITSENNDKKQNNEENVDYNYNPPDRGNRNSREVNDKNGGQVNNLNRGSADYNNSSKYGGGPGPSRYDNDY